MNHPNNQSSNRLSDSDFQCLQDQIVDLRTKNYELAETNKKQLNDFEIAKTKIVQLQQQLEEQERDFQVTSSTLRQEIDNISKEKDDDYKPKFKKLSLKTKDLQSKYEKTLERVASLEKQSQIAEQKSNDLEIENNHLKESSSTLKLQLDRLQEEHPNTISNLNSEHKLALDALKEQHFEEIKSLSGKCSILERENDQLKGEIKTFDERTHAQIEERKIHEKKGIRLVKELKRQLIVEKGRAEMFQKRLQDLLSSSVSVGGDVDPNLLANASISDSHVVNNVTDTSSVGSWSFMPGRNQNNVTNLTESVSLCSIDSEDRETVQISTDNLSEPSSPRRASTYSSKQGSPLSATNNSIIPNAIVEPPTKAPGGSNMLLEDQAALVDRVTKLQQEKWILEEKLNYLEMSNLSLLEELSKKSELIKHYCMNHGRTKAPTSVPGNHMLSTSSDPDNQHNTKQAIKLFTASLQNNRHPNNNNNLDKLSVKKVVEFIKDRSLTGNDLENLRETTRRMQLLLEETLTKNLHLQNNLDFVSAELEQIKSKQQQPSIGLVSE